MERMKLLKYLARVAGSLIAVLIVENGSRLVNCMILSFFMTMSILLLGSRLGWWD